MSLSRRYSRNSRSSSQYFSSAERDLSTTDEHNSYPPPPKHIPFPDIPQASEILNEFFMFTFATISAGLQFLNLYRTVFWLPESYNKQVVNFHLIDKHLALFLIVLLGRRFGYCVLLNLIDFGCPKVFQRAIKTIFKILYFVTIMGILAICCVQLYPKYTKPGDSFLNSIVLNYLVYPFGVYFLAFRLRLEPFFRTTFEDKESIYLNGSPLHCCSTNPCTIRDEIESLKRDYNNRFKQVIFTTLLNAYYAGFIPCLFASANLYYDIYWATQHMASLMFGVFTMCTIFCFPANYCDVLHRASLHLGQWNRVETRNITTPSLQWSNLVVWPAGSLVQHNNDMYRASGLSTTAIPSNIVHSRFYMFFQNPTYIYCILTVVQTSLIIAQLIILFFTTEWHKIVSQSFLLLVNYHTLFKIVRDYFVTLKIYSAENTIYNKFHNGQNGTN